MNKARNTKRSPRTGFVYTGSVRACKVCYAVGGHLTTCEKVSKNSAKGLDKPRLR